MNLTEKLSLYRSKYPSENSKVHACMQLLKGAQDCFLKNAFPGHFTGSAWTVNQSFTCTVLVLHRKLGKWVQPGGHADGERNLYHVARRELEEETGIMASPGQGVDIFDIDIHFIPAAGEEPPHHHYDIRFLFPVPEALHLRVSEESKDVRWISFDELEQYTIEESVLRMRMKCLT